MDNKILYESNGGSTGHELLFLMCGIIMSLFGVVVFLNVDFDLENDFLLMIGVALILAMGGVSLYAFYISKKSFLKIYSDHIEGRYFDIITALIGSRNAVTGNLIVNLKDINSVSSKASFFVIETQGKSYSIFCNDSKKAELIVLERLRENI